MTSLSDHEGRVINWVREFAARRSLPRDFFERMLLDDDWVLIVKASAVIETGLNEALAARMPAEWRESIIRLSMRTKRRMAVDAKMLPEKIDRAVETLTGLRNAIVHDAKGFQFDLGQHLSQPGKLDGFVAKVGWVMCPAQEIDRLKAPPQAATDSVTENPKFGCLMVALMVLLYLGDPVAPRSKV